MDPENNKRKKGGARLQKTESPAPAKSGTGKPPQAKKSPKPPRTRKQKVLLGVYITLTVIAALIVGGFIWWHIFSAPPDTNELPTRRPLTTTRVNEDGTEEIVELDDIPGLSSDRKKQFYTFLLVGQDTLGGGNTDTMMLVAYDVPNQKLNVMSLPRDTYVPFGKEIVQLNWVYNWAGGGDKGIEALKEAVGELTGVTPDYHVLLQWEAVGELVDAIDGVYFEVPFSMYYNDLSQHFKIDLKKGYQLLDGDKAMQLIRYRQNSIGDTGRIDYSYGYATGDLGRIQTQQGFMKAIIAKCLQPEVLLPNLTEYIRIFQDNVETNLTVSNMAYFAKSAIGGMDMEDVEFVTLPTKPAGGQLLPIGSEIVDAINNGFNPYLDDINLNELNLATRARNSGSSSSSSKPSETPVPENTPEPDPDTTPGVEPDPDNTAEPPANTPGAGMEPTDTSPTPESTESQLPPGVFVSPMVSPTPPPASTPTPNAESTPEPPAVPATEPPASPPAENAPGDVYGPGMSPIE